MVAVAWSAMAGAAIFERDDRIASVDPRLPVGIVSATASAYGSGFLIDPCHVLTAHHVIGAGDVVGRRIRFRMMSVAGDRSAGSVIASGGKPQRQGDYSDDWALVRLDQCLGNAAGFYPVSDSGFGRIGNSDRLSPALIGLGYPRDRGGRRLMVDPGCAARQRTMIGLLHDCAALPGGSGGPLIAWNAERSRYEEVAINVAQFPQRTAVAFTLDQANLAVELAPLWTRIEAATKLSLVTAR